MGLRRRPWHTRRNNPDRFSIYTIAKRKLDTNPYGLITEPRGRALVVTDAGGNSMLRVGANGRISTLAAFAPHPEDSDDSVPTSVAVGPDGAYYVGELTGIPVVTARANIYRVGRDGASPDVCLTDCTAIIDSRSTSGGTLRSQYATIFTQAQQEREPILVVRTGP